MADIYLHQKLAEDVYSALENPFEKDYFVTGSQGPDPFYYLILSNRFKRSREIGDRLHDTNINTLFAVATNYVKDHYSKRLHAFYRGFLLHFALDTNIHPYVYHHVGIYHKDNPDTYVMRGLHLRFERRMDACLIEEQTSNKAHRYPLIKALPLKTMPSEIADFIDHVVFETLGERHAKNLFKDAYKRMRKVIRHMIKDRSGIKSKLYKVFDLFNKQSDVLFKDMSFRNVDLSYDYLNRDHRSWRHPVTDEPSMKSVDDLYWDAYDDALNYLKRTDAYILNGQSLDFFELFKNRSFNSGINCDDPRPMQFFSLFTKP